MIELIRYAVFMFIFFSAFLIAVCELHDYERADYFWTKIFCAYTALFLLWCICEVLL